MCRRGAPAREFFGGGIGFDLALGGFEAVDDAQPVVTLTLMGWQVLVRRIGIGELRAPALLGQSPTGEHRRARRYVAGGVVEMPVEGALEVLGELVHLLVHGDRRQFPSADRAALAAELSAEGQLRVVVEVRTADQQDAAPRERLPALRYDDVVEQVGGVAVGDEFGS